MFYNGEGVDEPDYEKAAYWFEQSAIQDNSRAQLFLSRLYRYGKGVAKDKEKAVEWLQKSCKNGDERAVQEVITAFIEEQE